MFLTRRGFLALPQIASQEVVTGTVAYIMNARNWTAGVTDTIPDEMGVNSWTRQSPGVWGGMGGTVSGAPIDPPIAGIGYADCRSSGEFRSSDSSDPNLNVGTADWTVEFWIRFVTNANAFLVGRWRVSTHPFTFWMDGSQNFLFGASQTGASYDYVSASTVVKATPSLNTWYHVRANRVGNNFYIFFDGVLVQTIDVTGKTLSNDGSYLYLGNTASNCYITGFRFIKGQGLSTANFVRPSVPNDANLNNVSAIGSQVYTLLHLDGTNGSTTITESAPTTSLSWAVQGTSALSTAQSKFGAASLSSPGFGDRIQANYHSGMNLTNTDWTMDVWAFPNSTSQGFVFDGREVGGTGYGVIIQQSGASTWQFLIPNATNSAYTLNVATSNHLTSSAWHHLLMCRRGNIAYAFINGSLIGYRWLGTANVYNPSSTWKVGGYLSSFYFRGYVAEFRFVKGVGEKVKNFTAPSTAYAY